MRPHGTSPVSTPAPPHVNRPNVRSPPSHRLGKVRVDASKTPQHLWILPHLPTPKSPPLNRSIPQSHSLILVDQTQGLRSPPCSSRRSRPQPIRSSPLSTFQHLTASSNLIESHCIYLTTRTHATRACFSIPRSVRASLRSGTASPRVCTQASLPNLRRLREQRTTNEANEANERQREENFGQRTNERTKSNEIERNRTNERTNEFTNLDFSFSFFSLFSFFRFLWYCDFSTGLLIFAAVAVDVGVDRRTTDERRTTDDGRRTMNE